MSVNYELIGRRIKEIRKGKRVSQERLAEIVNLSTQYVSQIENARRKASLNTIVCIANALETSVDEILNGNQPMHFGEYNAEVELLFSDCSVYEKRVIYQIIAETKRILRENESLFNYKSNNSN